MLVDLVVKTEASTMVCFQEDQFGITIVFPDITQTVLCESRCLVNKPLSI